jgi:hypothetical protein
VVTPPVGTVPLVDTKPTCSKEPLVGIMYISRVSLKETEVEFALIDQGTVVSLVSAVKVMFVDVPQLGPSEPI